jgi:Tfp pilus assembly protein FimT
VIELVAVTSLITILGGIAAAHVLSSMDHSRGYAAARFFAGRLGLARTQAAARGAAVALRFTQQPRGFTFAVFQDGNGNGVRIGDIEAGVDQQTEPSTSVFEQFPGVDIGLSPHSPAANALQLSHSSLLTFTPLGTATSGTIHIRDARGSQWAVRILGATGRIRVLRYDPRSGEWLVAQ